MSFHRNHGDDRVENGVAYSNHGTSEVVMRSQFQRLVPVHAGRARHDAGEATAIPSAGADMAACSSKTSSSAATPRGPATGAQRIEPSHSPRATARRPATHLRDGAEAGRR